MEYKIMRQYHGKAAVEITVEEASARLALYYADTKGALRSMWNGGKCQTAGGWYWIEKEGSKAA